MLRRIALGYLIVWVLSPPLAYGATWRVLATLAMGVWLVLDLASKRSVLLRPNFAVLGAVAFALYALLIEAIVPDSAAMNRHFQIWIMLFFLLVGESFGRGREGDGRFCFWLVLLVLPIWSVTTLSGIATIGDDVSRLISRSSEEALALGQQGIGGFGFVYTLALCLPFLIYLTLRPRSVVDALRGTLRRRGARALLVVNALLGSIVILQAGYSIALLLAAIAFACVFLIRSRRALPFAMSLCVAGLLVFASVLALEPALIALQEVALGTEYSAKVSDIRASVENGRSVGTVENRMERYTRSFRLFIENPVLGTLTFDDVGKHSAILDRFAQYGIVVGALFVYLLAYVPLAAFRNRSVPVGLGMAFLAVAIVFPMMNNVFMSWGLVLYVFSRGALSAMSVPLQASRGALPVPREMVNA